MNNALVSGIPVPANPTSIERELRSLWKSASTQEGEGAVIRACSCNLIAFAGTPAEVQPLQDIVDTLAQQHPSRSLIVVADGANDLRAWISARCSLPITGGPQVCSEVITLAGGAQISEAVANTLLSLLVPDLPVYLYLPSFASPSLEVMTRLAPWSPMLVMDSRTKGGLSGGYLLEFMASPPSGVPIRDLEWARLTHWRDHIAQFFDGTDRRQLVSQVSDVEIHTFSASPTDLPTSGLFLAGWLCGSLDWQGGPGEWIDNRLMARLRGPSGEVTLSILADEAPAGSRTGIRSIVLRTRGGDSFSVCLDGTSGCVLAQSSFTADTARSVPHLDAGDAELLLGELTFSGRDTVFQEALRHALQIVGTMAPQATGAVTNNGTP